MAGGLNAALSHNTMTIDRALSTVFTISTCT